MKFRLLTDRRTHGRFSDKYTKEDVANYSRLGFKFAYIRQAYKIMNQPIIEIHSLKDLMSFIAEVGEVTMTKDTITIHDSFVNVFEERSEYTKTILEGYLTLLIRMNSL